MLSILSRWEPGSIRARIQWFLIPLIAVALIVATTALYVSARVKISNLIVEQTNLLAIATASVNSDVLLHRDKSELQQDVRKFRGKFVIRMRNAEDELIFDSHPDLPTFPRTQEAEKTVRGKGGAWLTTKYDLQSGRELLIAHPQEQADVIIWQMVLTSLAPLILVFSASVVAVLFAVRSGLLPLTHLSKSLEQRSADQLTALDTEGQPEELAPIVRALNNLFARIMGNMRRERQFIDDAAHELRTPLAAIKAQCQAIDPIGLNADTRRRFDNVIKGVDRAASLSDSLLNQAKADQSQSVRSHIEVAPIIRKTAADLLPLVERKEIELELVQVEDTWFYCSSLDLNVMLNNLLVNAIKYCPSGSKIRIALHRDRIAIEDNGPGIPSDMRDKVFERFVRLEDNQEQGAGLGLSVVRSLARRNQLHVKASEPEVLSGARFEIGQSHGDGRGIPNQQ